MYLLMRGNQMNSILIVDDDIEIRELFTAHLPKLTGFNVTVAASVDEAIDLIKTRPRFDLIISDYDMPKNTGDILLKFLSTNNLDSQFIFYSSSSPSYGDYGYKYFLGSIKKPLFPDLIQKILTVEST